MNLSQTQEKLMNRIKQLTSELSNNENFDGWICSSKICSKEFGWSKPRKSTLNSLKNKGLISVEFNSERHDYTARYNFGMDIVRTSYIEVSFKVKLN